VLSRDTLFRKINVLFFTPIAILMSCGVEVEELSVACLLLGLGWILQKNNNISSSDQVGRQEVRLAMHLEMYINSTSLFKVSSPQISVSLC